MKSFLKSKKQIFIFISSLIIYSIVLVNIAVAVDTPPTSEPGSDADPLVTKGYIDQETAKLQVKIDTLTAADKALGDKIIAIDTSLKQLATQLTNTTALLTKQITDTNTLLNTKVAELMAKDKLLSDAQVQLAAKDKLLSDAQVQLATKDKLLSDTLTQLAARVTALEKSMTALGSKSAATSQNASFVLIQLKAGKILTVSAGTEFMVRIGKATGISGKGGGIYDFTTGNGKDITTGMTVPLYHLLFVAKDDGRGVKAVSEIVYIYINGKYTIK